jgi:hypothetical protein
MTDLYKKDLDAHEMSFDAMPHKSVRKYKKRERQRAKKECRKHVDGTAERERDGHHEHLAEINKHADSSFEDFMREDE